MTENRREPEQTLAIKKTGNGLWEIGINSFWSNNDIILHREERALSTEFMQSDETRGAYGKKRTIKR